MEASAQGSPPRRHEILLVHGGRGARDVDPPPRCLRAPPPLPAPPDEDFSHLDLTHASSPRPALFPGRHRKRAVSCDRVHRWDDRTVHLRVVLCGCVRLRQPDWHGRRRAAPADRRACRPQQRPLQAHGRVLRPHQLSAPHFRPRLLPRRPRTHHRMVARQGPRKTCLDVARVHRDSGHDWPHRPHLLLL